jgi:hypothetical protein
MINRLIFTFAILLGSNNLVAQITVGNNSPAIDGKNVFIKYGYQPTILKELSNIYANNNFPKIIRQQLVEELLDKYYALPIEERKKRDLSSYALEKLDIEDLPEAVSILEFGNFLTTYGKNSPAIYAPAGDVRIWYGIPKNAFIGIYNLLEKKQKQLENDWINNNDLKKELAKHVKRYEDLEKELNSRPDFDEIAKQAKEKLDNGDIDGAERILEEDALRFNNEAAYRNFEVGKVKELNLKYNEATEYFRLAAILDKLNINYILSYGYNLLDISMYNESIKQFNLIRLVRF